MANKERTIGDVVDREIESLRAQQAKDVMPLIGPLLDAWDGVPNDLKGELEELGEAIADIERGMDGELPGDGGDEHGGG
jgi:hypothetical protein